MIKLLPIRGRNLLTLVFCFTLLHSHGQNILASSKKIPQQKETFQISLQQVLQRIAVKFDVRFAYEENLVKGKLVHANHGIEDDLDQTLSKVLKPLKLSHKKIKDGYYVIQKAPESGDRIKKLRPTLFNDAPDRNVPSTTGQIQSLNAKIPKWVEKIVSGKVTSESGEGLPGVNVLVKGTAIGTVTDVNGAYKLQVPDDATTLTFSFVGYLSEDVEIDNRTQIDIIMMPDVTNLEEVVVIGYGTQKKSDLTGSVGSVKSDVLVDRPAASVTEALAGRVAGVDVAMNSGRPGSATRVRIRGNNSINSSNDPLYVVDGIIGVGGIEFLNPNDIESIEVLKDASATAIYGARGANGVILVTTKRGRPEAATVTYNGFVSVGRLARKMDLLNAEEYMLIDRLAFENSEKFDPQGWAQGRYQENDPTDPSLSNLFDAEGNPLYDTDWQEEATRTAITHNHQLSIRGGSEKNTYGVFLGYMNQEGIVRTSFLERFNGRLTLDSNVKKWLKVGGNLSFNAFEENRIDSNVGGLSTLRMMAEALPIIPVKYPDGTWGSNADFPGTEGGDNPVNILSNQQDLWTRLQVLGNIYFQIDFTENLSLRSSVGLDSWHNKRRFYSGRELNSLSANQQGIAEIRNWRTTYWQNENYLNYSLEINENNRIEAMAGLSWQEFNSEFVFAGAEGFSDDFYQFNNLEIGAVPRPAESDVSQWNLNSYFARVNYTLNEKYLFTVTGRYDGSSRFGRNNRYSFFPSGAFAWRISDEGFFNNLSAISNLKLRASFGIVGNTEIGEFESIARLGTNTAIFGRERFPGTPQGSLANPDLKWERTEQFDIGVDLALFEGRVDFTADYYIKTTKDLLLSAPVPWSTGFSSVFRNIGSVENKGFEFSLVTRNITGDFYWETATNFYLNRNEVLALGEENDDIFPGPWFLGQTNILRVGEPVGSFWGPIRLGTWNTDEAAQAAEFGRLPGDLKYLDLNNDGVINGDDHTIIGNNNPDWTMNIANTFRYKGFEFMFDLQFVQGVDVFLMTKHSVEDRQTLANSYATVLNAWTPENQNTPIAQVRRPGAGYDTNSDTHWLEDGSFIRGRNVRLLYNFPLAKIENLGLQNLQLYLSGQNLFVITEFTGYDPEFSTYGQAFSQGIEFFQYPKPRTFTLGLNVTF